MAHCSFFIYRQKGQSPENRIEI